MSMPTDSGMKMRPRSMAGVAIAANCADGRHSTMTSQASASAARSMSAGGDLKLSVARRALA